jgi:hypothetical protein
MWLRNNSFCQETVGTMTVIFSTAFREMVSWMRLTAPLLNKYNGTISFIFSAAVNHR